MIQAVNFDELLFSQKHQGLYTIQGARYVSLKRLDMFWMDRYKLSVLYFHQSCCNIIFLRFTWGIEMFLPTFLPPFFVSPFLVIPCFRWQGAVHRFVHQNCLKQKAVKDRQQRFNFDRPPYWPGLSWKPSLCIIIVLVNVQIGLSNILHKIGISITKLQLPPVGYPFLKLAEKVTPPQQIFKSVRCNVQLFSS